MKPHSHSRGAEGPSAPEPTAEREYVAVMETRDPVTNCREFAPVRRREINSLVDEYTEFADLWGRSIKVAPSRVPTGVPAVLLLYGTDPLLLQGIAEELGVNEQTLSTIVSVLSSGAKLCPQMAKEIIRALQAFVDENPDCPG